MRRLSFDVAAYVAETKKMENATQEFTMSSMRKVDKMLLELVHTSTNDDEHDGNSIATFEAQHAKAHGDSAHALVPDAELQNQASPALAQLPQFPENDDEEDRSNYPRDIQELFDDFEFIQENVDDDGNGFSIFSILVEIWRRRWATDDADSDTPLFYQDWIDDIKLNYDAMNDSMYRDFITTAIDKTANWSSTFATAVDDMDLA